MQTATFCDRKMAYTLLTESRVFLSADSWDTGPEKLSSLYYSLEIKFSKASLKLSSFSTMASKLADSKIDSMLMKLPDETGKGGNI